jgi:hypothetical protein
VASSDEGACTHQLFKGCRENARGEGRRRLDWFVFSHFFLDKRTRRSSRISLRLRGSLSLSIACQAETAIDEIYRSSSSRSRSDLFVNT